MVCWTSRAFRSRIQTGRDICLSMHQMCICANEVVYITFHKPRSHRKPRIGALFRNSFNYNHNNWVAISHNATLSFRRVLLTDQMRKAAASLRARGVHQSPASRLSNAIGVDKSPPSWILASLRLDAVNQRVSQSRSV